jgi:putative ATP-binding cassette transporter
MTAVPIGATEPRLAPLFRLNYWSRDFFDAFGRRDAVTLQAEALLFPLLAGARILVAVLTISARMTTQRKWRACLSRNLIARWLGGDYPGLAECLSSVNCVTAPRAGLDDLENDGIGR